MFWCRCVSCVHHSCVHQLLNCTTLSNTLILQLLVISDSLLIYKQCPSGLVLWLFSAHIHISAAFFCTYPYKCCSIKKTSPPQSTIPYHTPKKKKKKKKKKKSPRGDDSWLLTGPPLSHSLFFCLATNCPYMLQYILLPYIYTIGRAAVCHVMVVLS